MRKFQILDHVETDKSSQIITISASDAAVELLFALRREGSYIAMSISHGPMEMALRPRYDELVRVFTRLKPISGPQTTRQVGTGQAYIALGLQVNGTLVVRPTLVSDATGHLTFNLMLTGQVRETLFGWLDVPDSAGEDDF